jgi:hypothetical protein
MSARLRDWANEHQGIVTLIAIVATVIALAIVLSRFRGPSTNVSHIHLYYMDMQTGEFFTHPSRPGASPTSPAGNPSMRATTFACGSCRNVANVVGGYVSDVIPEEERPDGMEESEAGIVSADGKDWVWAGNEAQAMEITTAPTCPDGSRARICSMARD